MKKIIFYFKNFSKFLIPKILYEARLNSKLEDIKLYDREYIINRVNYYNKLSSPFILSRFETYKTFKLSTPIDLGHYKRKKQISAYFFDFREHMIYFSRKDKFNTIFCDLRDIPNEPSFVKSRNISKDNQNAVILKLDKTRHFTFLKDPNDFITKKNVAVFRGPCHQEHRQKFISTCYNIPNTNFGDTRESEKSKPYYKSFMSPYEQMKYKYIISVEGNDVATNLKWIMNSNSLCFMTKPKCETWFMEGILTPGYHYVMLKDDYSDLEEKIAFYNKNPDSALEIIKNANEYVNQFKDKKREELISLLVMKKYFDLQK
ncbi:glycosyl transferase family 90 [Pseudofrancisella aestuarii]|uniref:Glycosyl transferase family 90 n=1 Tax=Pseudofrancisella aestuarii TaxID=2670347 RepID=A0ABV9TCK3_9GAMM|nr:glycosyl transferase family 90 [Pseudofrancisella aestuarii]